MKYIVTGTIDEIKLTLKGENQDKMIKILIKAGATKLDVYCMEGEHRSIKCHVKVL